MSRGKSSLRHAHPQSPEVCSIILAAQAHLEAERARQGVVEWRCPHCGCWCYCERCRCGKSVEGVL